MHRDVKSWNTFEKSVIVGSLEKDYTFPCFVFTEPFGICHHLLSAQNLCLMTVYITSNGGGETLHCTVITLV
jgi:hypothetical protein